MSDKKKNLITPAGTLLFPSLNKPDDKFANGDPTKASYTTLLVLSEEDAQAIIEAAEAAFEEGYERLCRENKKTKLKRAEFPWTEHTDAEGNEIPGELRIRFKMKSQTAKGTPMRPVLVDAKKQPIDRENVIIGSGSTAKISYRHYVWYAPSIGVGLTLQLNGVQVLELQEFTGGDCGFDEEEGYEAAAAGDSFGGDDENGDF